MQYGPFVMNTRAEIQQAFADYQRTRFGGWPWPSDDPVHARDEGRFARHADGRVERAQLGAGTHVGQALDLELGPSCTSRQTPSSVSLDRRVVDVAG